MHEAVQAPEFLHQGLSGSQCQMVGVGEQYLRPGGLSLLGGTSAYVGFTSGAGSEKEFRDILSWKFNAKSSQQKDKIRLRVTPIETKADDLGLSNNNILREV